MHMNNCNGRSRGKGDHNSRPRARVLALELDPEASAPTCMGTKASPPNRGQKSSSLAPLSGDPGPQTTSGTARRGTSTAYISGRGRVRKSANVCGRCWLKRSMPRCIAARMFVFPTSRQSCGKAGRTTSGTIKAARRDQRTPVTNQCERRMHAYGGPQTIAAAVASLAVLVGRCGRGRLTCVGNAEGQRTQLVFELNRDCASGLPTGTTGEPSDDVKNAGRVVAVWWAWACSFSAVAMVNSIVTVGCPVCPIVPSGVFPTKALCN